MEASSGAKRSQERGRPHRRRRAGLPGRIAPRRVNSRSWDRSFDFANDHSLNLSGPGIHQYVKDFVPDDSSDIVLFAQHRSPHHLRSNPVSFEGRTWPKFETLATLCRSKRDGREQIRPEVHYTCCNEVSPPDGEGIFGRPSSSQVCCARSLHHPETL